MVFIISLFYVVFLLILEYFWLLFNLPYVLEKHKPFNIFFYLLQLIIMLVFCFGGYRPLRLEF